jgi:hypothetical protein
MRLRTIWLLLFFITVIASAQNPQTQTAPIYATNAKYANGVAPGYAPTAGTGLNLALGPGTANCSGTIETYSGGTLALTSSTTNYVYLNTSASCAPIFQLQRLSPADLRSHRLPMIERFSILPELPLLQVVRFFLCNSITTGL